MLLFRLRWNPGIAKLQTKKDSFWVVVFFFYANKTSIPVIIATVIRKQETFMEGVCSRLKFFSTFLWFSERDLCGN